MEKQRYNLKDVAKLAGVSLGTASKVIDRLPPVLLFCAQAAL